MAQAALSFQYQGTSNGKFTALAGLPLFVEMANACGLTEAISQNLKTKSRGWTDLQNVFSLVLLNLAGGDCVDEIEKLESDTGFSFLLRSDELKGMSRQVRRAYQKRFRKEKKRAFPSASVLRRYLETFHDSEEEKRRVEGTAFIPQSNKALKTLQAINKTLIDYAQSRNPCTTATLDGDATLAASNKRTSKFCYKKFSAYQPFNTYWAEQRLLLHSEFRDGNVNAGFDQKRLLEEAFAVLPEGVETVMLRSDSAAYQEDLIRYCSKTEHERFASVEFAISTKGGQKYLMFPAGSKAKKIPITVSLRFVNAFHPNSPYLELNLPKRNYPFQR